MVLLLITTLAAMLMAHRGLPPLQLIFFTLFGGALAAGGAGAINHYLDRDVDELMGRTSARPIPAGMVPPLNGLFFGICLGILSFTLMVAFVNVLSAVLTLCALLFYVFVYTRWLKRWTSLNIVIGGAAGAIPPVVGIAAVTNEVNWLAIWLFTIIFVWTPPHFWALSLLMQREYAAAGIPMLPIVRGEEETRKQILGYSLTMVALTVAVWTFGLLGVVYAVSAAALGGDLHLLRGAPLARGDGDGGAPAVPLLDPLSGAAVRGDGGGPPGAPVNESSPADPISLARARGTRLLAPLSLARGRGWGWGLLLALLTPASPAGQPARSRSSSRRPSST